MSTQPFIIERTFNAPVNTVWQAITDNNKMKEWYFDLPEFKPKVGFEFTFSGGSEEKTYVHLCRVTEVMEGHKLSHTWAYEGYEGNSLVTWELFGDGDKTKVILTHSGLETFPQSKDFARESFTAGWNHIVGIALKEYVEKQG